MLTFDKTPKNYGSKITHVKEIKLIFLNCFSNEFQFHLRIIYIFVTCVLKVYNHGNK